MAKYHVNWKYAAWISVSEPPSEPHLVVLGTVTHACLAVELRPVGESFGGDHWPYEIWATWDETSRPALTEWKIERALSELRPAIGFVGITLVGPPPEDNWHIIDIPGADEMT